MNQNCLLNVIISLACLCTTASRAAPKQYPYHIISLHGASHHKPVLTSSRKQPFRIHQLYGLLSPNNHPLDRQRLEKLVFVYAHQLTPCKIPGGQIDTLIEQQLRQWHQEGMKAEDIQAHFHVKTMKKVRKKLKTKFKTELSIQYFLKHLFIDNTPTPAQVAHFYHLYLEPQNIHVPLKIVLGQIVCYPKNTKKSLEASMAYMQSLYKTLSLIKNPKKRLEHLSQVLREQIQSSPPLLTYHFLFNHNNISQITLAELPSNLRKTLLPTPTSQPTLGMLSIPTTFIDEHGAQGIRILFIKAYIPSHPLNLADDYVHIEQMCKTAHQQAKLKRWWELHKQETEVYGLS